jgi:hypothetical protein
LCGTAANSGFAKPGAMPEMGEAALIRIEGCDQCTSCDHSRCG